LLKTRKKIPAFPLGSIIGLNHRLRIYRYLTELFGISADLWVSLGLNIWRPSATRISIVC